MTDLDHEIIEPSSGEPGRARARKTKRAHGADSASRTDAVRGQRMSARRDSRRTGPSMRERLVAAHINLPTEKIQSLQGKLSSTLNQVAQQLATDQSSQSDYNDDPSPRSRRHRSEALSSESASQAAAQAKRKDRSDQPYHPRKNRRQFDARSEAVPPVMVRGGMGGMAFGRVASSRLRKQHTPKRRFDVPLSVPGAEVRLPSLPIIHLGWKGVSLIIVVLSVISLIMMWKSPVFQVKTVEAKGLQRLTTNDLNVVLGTVGQSVFSLDPLILRQNLQQAFPELAKVSVRVNLPARIQVVAVEREPIISWTQEGRESWVDAEGISFPVRGTPASSLVKVEGYGTLPVDTSISESSLAGSLPPGMPFSATSAIPTFKLSGDLVTAILGLAKKMPADTVLVYDSEHGLGWNDPNGWEVFFGAEDQDMEMKLAVYQALVAQLQSEGIQPAMISVEYVHAPYYRMER